MKTYTKSIAINFDIIYLTKLKKLTSEALIMLQAKNSHADKNIVKSMQEDIKMIDQDLLPFYN